MKKIINSNTTKTILRVVCMFIIVMAITSIKAHADVISDPGGDPDSAPIDGGLSLLIAGGVGYGVKRAREKKKQQQQEQEK